MIILLPLLRKIRPEFRIHAGVVLGILTLALIAVTLLTSVHLFVGSAIGIVLTATMIGSALRDRRRAAPAGRSLDAR